MEVIFVVQCKICGREFENGNYLSAHLKFEEHISGQEYYDTYLKNDNEGICLVCGKPTKYINFTRGYQKCCSQECNNSPLSNKGKNISEIKQSYTEEQKLCIKEKREIYLVILYTNGTIMIPKSEKEIHVLTNTHMNKHTHTHKL